MPDIDPSSVTSINSIADKYPDWRQLSKAPTFLLTYGGTYIGLMQNVGLSKAQALSVEENYHNLYKVSDQWVADKIDQASDDGYVTVAFGLRVRTPMLKSCMMKEGHKVPYEAKAEARTAGNALGQSYGLLNNRAGIELYQRLLKSEFKHMIRPAAHIHDAQYFVIPDYLPCIKWLNDNLGECMAWQELPEIQHDEVKLSGELDIFYPNWSNAMTIKNGMSEEEIDVTINEKYKKYLEEKAA